MIDDKSPTHHCVVNHLRLVGQISVKLDCQQLNDMLESVFAVGSADGLILKPYLSALLSIIVLCISKNN